jgi:hypothetical protein
MPEYTKHDVVRIAGKQKAVIWLTLIFAASLVYFSVATVRWTLETARDVVDNKQIQEWVRIHKLNEWEAKPGFIDPVAKPGDSRLFMTFLVVSLPHLPYIPLAGVAIIYLVFVYQLATALKLRAWLWCISMIIPFVGLLVLPWLNGKAVSALRSQGIAVGLLGAKKADLKKFAASDLKTE